MLDIVASQIDHRSGWVYVTIADGSVWSFSQAHQAWWACIAPPMPDCAFRPAPREDAA
jgi:hypothetical protein